MTVITDPLAAVIRFLKADADTAEMVGAHIFGGELPDAEIAGMPRACILIAPSGGPVMPISDSYIEVSDMRLDLFAYGPTPNSAFRVYRCLAGALKQMQRNVQGKTLLHWARNAGGPNRTREANTEWPLVLSTWQVMWAERETT